MVSRTLPLPFPFPTETNANALKKGSGSNDRQRHRVCPACSGLQHQGAPEREAEGQKAEAPPGSLTEGQSAILEPLSVRTCAKEDSRASARRRPPPPPSRLHRSESLQRGQGRLLLKQVAGVSKGAPHAAPHLRRLLPSVNHGEGHRSRIPLLPLQSAGGPTLPRIFLLAGFLYQTEGQARAGGRGPECAPAPTRRA